MIDRIIARSSVAFPADFDESAGNPGSAGASADRRTGPTRGNHRRAGCTGAKLISALPFTVITTTSPS